MQHTENISVFPEGDAFSGGEKSSHRRKLFLCLRSISVQCHCVCHWRLSSIHYLQPDRLANIPRTLFAYIRVLSSPTQNAKLDYIILLKNKLFPPVSGVSQSGSVADGLLGSILTVGNLKRVKLNSDNQTGEWKINIYSTQFYSLRVTGKGF